MNKTSRGFSMLEMLVAVAIMVLMTALAAPSLLKFSEALTLRSATTQLSTMMRLAQRYAINYNAVYRVDISPQEDWAAIYSNETGGSLIGDVYFTPRIVDIATTTITGTSAADLVKNGSVLFYGKGGASPSCYIHVVRTNSVFTDTEDSGGAAVTDPVRYYESGYNYSTVSDDQKQQCYTLEVKAAVGRVTLHKEGKGAPWE